MTDGAVEELIDVIAAKAAGELVAELYGSSVNMLPASQKAQYVGEIASHIRDWLTVELETAVGVARAEHPPPGEWADRREFDRIVAKFQQETPR